MFAYRHALQLKFTVLFRHRDQREVGGAAADVHYQNQIARRNLLAPIVVAFDPGVEGSLRFFEDRDIRKPSGMRGPLCQFTRRSIEGRRHRDQHVLFGELRFGMRLLPSRAQMQQILARHLNRRDLLDAFRSIQRKQRLGGIGVLIRKPGLRGGNQARGVLYSACSCQMSCDVSRLRIPRQRKRAFDKLLLAGNI